MRSRQFEAKLSRDFRVLVQQLGRAPARTHPSSRGPGRKHFQDRAPSDTPSWASSHLAMDASCGIGNGPRNETDRRIRKCVSRHRHAASLESLGRSAGLGEQELWPLFEAVPTARRWRDFQVRTDAPRTRPWPSTERLARCAALPTCRLPVSSTRGRPPRIPPPPPDPPSSDAVIARSRAGAIRLRHAKGDGVP